MDITKTAIDITELSKQLNFEYPVFITNAFYDKFILTKQTKYKTQDLITQRVFKMLSYLKLRIRINKKTGIYDFNTSFDFSVETTEISRAYRAKAEKKTYIPEGEVIVVRLQKEII